ncbi:Nif3-like dinuclear metal center hexameric protein [Cetobacterium sp.]|uniref:Nif3-like dinuclear metal center hexameric protein n=1 Tax=Cetobacterium sp. TaxID=2071632 RepID=UPI002FCB3CB0
MKLSKIISYLEEKFPLNLSEEWDNVGLLVGRRDSEVEKILLSLDVTDKVIDEAIEVGANLIITHHPVIFKPLKAVTGDTTLGKKVLKLIENRIAVYSMHTNLDSAKSGLNDFLGETVLNFGKGKILEKSELNGREFGIGRIYKLDTPINIKKLSQNMKETLGLDCINVVTSDENLSIKKIALVSGAGSTYWRKAKKLGADILLTGDIKYHEAMDAKEENFSLMDIGHFESECIFVKHLKTIIEKEFKLEILHFNDGPVFQKM